MAIDDAGEWWIGSEPGDIQTYLRVYSEGGYPVTAFRLIRCHCGNDRFLLERAFDTVRRECVACRSEQYLCRRPEDGKEAWEEAVDEEGAEPYSCIGCQSFEANVGVGFAGYSEVADLDAVKWFYVGVRCASCGILGCFNDGKMGRGPAAEVYRDF